MSQLTASSTAGYLSIACWVIVFAPQLWENYRRQSGEGLSMTFLVIWLAGDVFNLVGVILQQLLPTMFWLALWYTVADMGLIWQIIYYRRNGIDTEDLDVLEPLLRPPQPASQKKAGHHGSNAIAFASILLVTLASCYAFYGIEQDKYGGDRIAWLPQAMGWSSAVLYVGSRIPQIQKNWKSKSTEGLSLGMFFCAVLGNVLFTASIFLRSRDPHYILVNLSWIIGSCGTLVFDFTIFIQFFVYDKGKKRAKPVLGDD